MEVIQDGKNVVIKDVEDFLIEQTMECGQCFHFRRIAENEYGVVHFDKLLHIKQQGNEVTLYNTTYEDYENVWKAYFDLDRDYGKIKKALLSKDKKLQEAIEQMWGVRILNQDFFEMLISFIISQNKQIPHIKQIVFTLSEKYGKYLGTIEGEEYYSFPDVNALSRVSEEDLRLCKTGFRAPYICDAVKKVKEGIIDEGALRSLEENMAQAALTEIKGVGDKVANCVMLFSLNFREAFPVDVWIKRIMEEMYFQKEEKKEVISEFARKHFGKYGGYAQQYLFYYGREKGLKSKKVKKTEKTKEKPRKV